MSSLKYFREKLLALEYPNTNNFDLANESAFRCLIVFLEDKYIKLYKIEDRSNLRAVSEAQWRTVFNKYLDDVMCPLKGQGDPAVVDWILGKAVGYLYADKDLSTGYSAMTSEAYKQKIKQQAQSTVNPLDGLDVESDEFKAGVVKLAELLNIPPHPDHKQVIKAACLLIEEKLSKKAIEKAKREAGKVKKEFLNVEDLTTGLRVQEGGGIQEVALILRLLHVHQLRDLQTSINAAIVAVQEVTADPKTDERLGKVGF